MNVKSLYPIIVPDDLAKATAFYTEMLGYRVKHDVTRKDGGHVLVLTNDAGLEMELMEKNEKGPVIFKPGLYGLRMNVDDIDAALDELKEKGCEIVAGPLSTPSGKNLLIRDADGINITLIQHIK